MSALYGALGSVFLNGGKIYDNTGNSSDKTSAVEADTFNSINISGDIQIYGNKNKSTNVNLHVGNKLLNVTDDFTGNVYLHTNKYKAGEVFGKVLNGASISGGIIVNERNTALQAVIYGDNLVWQNTSLQMVARVETAEDTYTYYSDLASAITAGSLTMPVELIQDISLSSTYNLTKNVKIKSADPLNPQTILRDFDSGDLINLNTTNITLELEDIIIEDNKSEQTSAYNLINVGKSGSKLILSTGAVIQNSVFNEGGSAVYLQNNSTFELRGGKITNNTGLGSSAIGFGSTGGNAYMYEGEVSGNMTTGQANPGAINFTAGKLYISGSSVIANNKHVLTDNIAFFTIVISAFQILRPIVTIRRPT